MKTVTAEQAQSTFPDLLRLVARGQEIRGTEPVDWAGTWSRVDAIFGGKPAPGKPGSQIIIEGRR